MWPIHLISSSPIRLGQGQVSSAITRSRPSPSSVLTGDCVPLLGYIYMYVFLGHVPCRVGAVRVGVCCVLAGAVRVESVRVACWVSAVRVVSLRVACRLQRSVLSLCVLRVGVRRCVLSLRVLRVGMWLPVLGLWVPRVGM